MCLVEGLTGWVVLLPVAVARLRIAGHDDSRLGAVDPRLPRVACLNEMSVLQLQRVLAHVPDVALLVLRVPVEGPLDRAPVFGNRIPDDCAADAEDPLGLTSHDLIVGLRSLSTNPLVVKNRAGLERPVPVVDGGDEVRRVD